MLFSRSIWPWQRRFGKTALASWFFVLVTFLIALRFLALPNLQRLHLQVGVSLFDDGFYGFYPTRKYVSFEYESPAVELAKWSPKCSDDYTFMAPHGSAVENPGAMILDSRGNLVWMMKPRSDKTQDFRVQEYLGEQYLTYWHGAADNGHGRGAWSMLDTTYTPRFEVKAVGNHDGDMHDFQITKNGTAMVIVYDVQPTDLSQFGGPEYGYFSECLFQEIDIATGELIFEWRMSEHVPLNASYEQLKDRGWSTSDAYDVFHMNSIDKDSAGNYLVSARHTHSIMSIDGRTGEILWTLGGKFNDFTDASDGQATNFCWQHDARWRGERTLTLFDNTAEQFMDGPTESRGMTLELDTDNKIARLRSEYYHPEGIRATSQGNMQVLPNSGNVLIAWGHCAAFTEFSSDGEMLCDTHFAPSNWFQLGQAVSYRIAKGRWAGQPNTNPKGAVVDSSVFVSWNGATEVRSWRLELWDGVDMKEMKFHPHSVAQKEGFETEIELPNIPHVYFRVAALNDKGELLGATDTLSWQLRESQKSPLAIPPGIVLSISMIACCVLLGAYWIWRRCTRHKSQILGYKPVSLAVSEISEQDEEARSFLRASVSSADRPTLLSQP
ncbi:hypothetical protein N7466_002894 [Penicillium verhagenii]|uniref:uncharacterized protein n=1 Tax=Penicillium verhagenii TaxID=1562060 RepID=UPI002544DACD|nr:uncharacterized protein N7466_002894 [Penicillium verhagenii]KAJ5939760.1 hypothetical protein N7466_002894 [Penicillium verhagenii]